MSLLAAYPYVAVIVAVLWSGVACLLPFVRHHWQFAVLWALVVTGVPVLGWLTYLFGPAGGVLFLAIGLALLVWPPAEVLRRRRHSQAGRGWH